MADKKAQFVALVARIKCFEAKKSQFFVVSDILIAYNTRSDT